MKSLYLLLLLPGLVLADGDCRGNCPRTDDTPTMGMPVTLTSEGDSVNLSSSDDLNISTETTLNSEGATVDVTGPTNNTRNSTTFFSFSTSFPNATGCFAGVQGGASGSSGSGFGGLIFGAHRMDANCWLNQLAESEKNSELRALLKCGDKHFRNSVTFDIDGTKKQKQRYCVDYISAIYLEEIKYERSVAEKCKTGTCSYVNGELHFTTD